MTIDPAPGTPSWLRARNERTALGLLFENGPLTRNRLGELSGLSKPTAAQMVARLEEAGIIAPVGEVSGGRGPNAISYGVRPDRLRAVAVDIRENLIAAMIVDALDTTHPVVELPTDSLTRSPENDVRAALAAAADAAGIDPATVRIAGIGVQAAIVDDGDSLAFTDTLPGWPTTGARTSIQSSLGLETLLANDVNLAAAAERATGAARDASSSALLWLGDGIGLALDLGGSIFPGSRGSAGEIGYLSVPRAASALDPAADDFTDLLGGPAISALIRRHAPNSADATTLPDLLAGPGGDAAYVELAKRVAVVLAPVLAVLDPELVVLGGPTGAAGGERLARLVGGRLDLASGWTPRVVASAVTSQPVLGGARTVLVQRIRERLLADLGALDS